MPALRRALRRACRHAAAHAPVILLAGANHALLSGSERREGDLAPELDAAAVTRCAAGVLGDFLAAHAGAEPCAPAAQGTLLYLTLPQFTLLTLLIICPCPPCSPRRWRSAGSCLRSRLPRRQRLAQLARAGAELLLRGVRGAASMLAARPAEQRICA